MVQIVADSTCDLSRERLAQIGVVCVPLTVFFGEETFTDGVDLTPQEFYHKLRTKDETPTTAQPTPYLFEEVFRKALDNGDEVLCLFLGGKLSGTAQSANIAKETIGSDKIQIIDTDNVCASLGLLVEIAAKRAKEGVGILALFEEMKELCSRVKFFCAVETLKYLRKGGRLSGTAAIMGTMLNLHPIVTIENGLIVNIAKEKGKRRLISKMKELTMSVGVDEAYPIMFSQADAMDNMERLKEQFVDMFDNSNCLTSDIGAVVGTHIGPGCTAIAFIAKK